MNLIRDKQALCFDDVLIVPQYSDIRSRKDISLQSGMLEFPVISSPMNTVTEDRMAIALGRFGGLGIIHRYCTIERQSEMVQMVRSELGPDKLVGSAIGVTGDWLERSKALVSAGCDLLCIDIAHGHTVLLKEVCENKEFRNLLENNEVTLMAGNVATFEGFRYLEKLGVQMIRASLGAGSICKTKIQTHHGLPTLQTLLNITKGYQDWSAGIGHRDAWIVADGGMKTSGDAVCALAAGADYLMFGSLFSGTEESPGPIIEQNGKPYKEYNGQASKKAQIAFKGSYNSDEGVSTLVPYKGPVIDVLKDLDNGLRSGLSYSGARTIMEFQDSAILQVQTQSSYKEGTPHILGNNQNVSN